MSRKLQFRPLDGAAIGAFLAYSASAVATPICLLALAEELELSLSQAGLIEVSRSLLILLVLFASGFVAARWGKTLALAGSLLLMGAGLMLYAAAPHFAAVLLAGGVIGLGAGIVEGLVNPLVQDLHPGDSGRYLNIINGFWSVGVVATVLLTGDLLARGVSWRQIMVGVGVLALLAGASFLLLRRHGGAPTGHTALDVLGHKREILLHPRFRLFAPMMFLAGGAEGAYTFWSATLIQLEYAGSPRAGGVGTACFAGGMVLGRFLSGWLVGQRGLWWLIILSAAAGLAISLAAPLVHSLAGLYGVLVLAGLAVACFWPSIQAYAADRMPVDSTALFILLSCGGIPGFAFASWIMGVIGDAAGLQASFRLVPVFFAALALLLLVERRWAVQAAAPALANEHDAA